MPPRRLHMPWQNECRDSGPNHHLATHYGRFYCYYHIMKVCCCCCCCCCCLVDDGALRPAAAAAAKMLNMYSPVPAVEKIVTPKPPPIPPPTPTTRTTTTTTNQSSMILYSPNDLPALYLSMVWMVVMTVYSRTARVSSWFHYCMWGVFADGDRDTFFSYLLCLCSPSRPNSG